MSADGGPLIRTNLWVTGGFAVASALTHLLAESLDVAFAVACSVLFGVGIALFLLGFWNGVQRSRIDDVNLVGLLAVSRANVDASPRRQIWLANIVQIVVALVAASLRPFTEQAFAVLAPMFGIGIAALWGARYAAFHPREDDRTH